MAGPLTELARWRADTPGSTERIHLNNAGAALPPRPVLEAVIAHLRREAEIGGYEAADEAADGIARSYAAVARLVGCAPNNIAIVENATVAVAQATRARSISVPATPSSRAGPTTSRTS